MEKASEDWLISEAFSFLASFQAAFQKLSRPFASEVLTGPFFQKLSVDELLKFLVVLFSEALDSRSFLPLS
jgi:hypothetical protein